MVSKIFYKVSMSTLSNAFTKSTTGWYLCCKPMGKGDLEGLKSPSRVQGRSPVRGSGGQSPPENEEFLLNLKNTFPGIIRSYIVIL